LEGRTFKASRPKRRGSFNHGRGHRGREVDPETVIGEKKERGDEKRLCFTKKKEEEGSTVKTFSLGPPRGKDKGRVAEVGGEREECLWDLQRR